MKFKRKIFGVAAVGFLLAVILFFAWPLSPALTNPTDRQPVKILDRDGKLLYEARQPDFGAQEYLPFTEIPSDAIQILLAVEDKTFYSHPGVSARGIARAAWQNLMEGRVVSGGSTITQQLVRNKLQPKKRGYLYKLKEILFALKLETRLSKKEILESYFNSVYFGHQAYGIQAAARMYFGKNISELSRAETALLIGLIKSPVSYDPFSNFALAKERQKIVLGMIGGSGEMEKEPIHLSSGKINIRAPHFVMWVLADDPEKNIRTTLDSNLQSEVERIVENQLQKLKGQNVTSAAVIVLDAATGEVLAMVGSADYFDTEHDGAVNVALAPRQPGSALKPFTYALAQQLGDTAAMTVADTEAQFFTQEGNPYNPRNYDYGYHGLVRYREALANSYNIAAVKVLEKVGVERLLDFLKKAGLTTLTESPDHYGLALTLGSAEVRLLELAQAYGMLARGGVTLPVKKLADEMLSPGKRILDEKIAWLITDILSDNGARLPEFGENSPLAFDFPVAAKTGTTRNSRDNWTIGYTPDRVVGIWVGNADNSPMRGTSGVTGAGPIFHDVMIAANRNLPHKNFTRPNGLVQKEVCKLSGKLPTAYCPHNVIEWFIMGTEPRETDDIYQPIKLDKRNGLRANEFCPREFVEEEVFAVFPPEVQKWARENGWPSPPADYSPLCRKTDGQSTSDGWIIISKPNAGESFLLDPIIPDENEKIIFEASAGENIKSIDWLVDGKKVGSGQAPNFRYEWQPSPGKFGIKAKSGNTEEKIIIEILYLTKN